MRPHAQCLAVRSFRYQVCFKGRQQNQSLSRSLKVKIKVQSKSWSLTLAPPGLFLSLIEENNQIVEFICQHGGGEVGRVVLKDER